MRLFVSSSSTKRQSFAKNAGTPELFSLNVCILFAKLFFFFVLLLLLMFSFFFRISKVSNGWFHFCSAIGLSVNVSMDRVNLFLFLFRFFFQFTVIISSLCSAMCVIVHCCEWEKEIYTYVYLTKRNKNIHSIRFSCQMKIFGRKVMNT